MMVSRYILPLFIILVVGALILKGIKPGKAQAADIGDPSPKVARDSGIQGVALDRVEGNQEHWARWGQEEHLAEAARLYRKRDFDGALAVLDRAWEIASPCARVLNLRGSCHVGMRDFGRALADFEKASELAQGNPSICFNIGEVHFVTKQWLSALEAFQNLTRQLPPENTKLTRLVDFKVMLCQHRLGQAEEMAALAAKYESDDSSPFHWYASALFAAEANDCIKQAELLSQAALKFPNPRELAPWNDTMAEYAG